jgi:hypothetical protein
MGLDLYHLKATLRPSEPEEAHTFREDDFDDYALEVLGFRRFIQTILEIGYPPRIRAVKDERALDFLRAHRSTFDDEGVEIFVVAPSELKRRVEEFEKARGLDAGRRWVMATTEWIDQSGCHMSHGHGWDRPLDERLWEPTEWVIKQVEDRPPVGHLPVQIASISYAVSYPYPGLYAEEIGYQRKGMSPAFYEAFGTPTWYFRRSDVERAASLIIEEGRAEEDRKRREFFANQFLEGFEEGVSIFYVSW